MFGPFPSQDIEALGWNPLETHSSSLCLLAPSMATSITAACQSLRFFFNFFFHVDVNIRSCHTAVTNLTAALQEGEPMLLTFGAAAAWSSWSTPVPSCLQGTRTAGDPPAWTNTEQPECPVLPAGASLLSSATTGKKKLNGEASSLEKGEQLLLCLP